VTGLLGNEDASALQAEGSEQPLSAALGGGRVSQPVDRPSFGPVSSARTEVALERVGGTFRIPVRINDQLTIKFTVDTGASDVSIPADVVLTLIRTDTISSGDFLGERPYTLADGSTVKSQRFTIHKLQVGDIILENVMASMGDPKGVPLLGQSFLSRFESVTQDNKKQVLVITK